MDINILSQKERNDLLKKLFLYTVGLRDMWLAKKCFNELKDLSTNSIADLDNVGKTYIFIICYGRIFHTNEGIGRLKIKAFLKTLSSKERYTNH
ncbi:MAG: hypothetical protein EPO11_03930 [Gammaproteobacteria bacterium]|nr:MAG: hypothetical protein EPO11_03930 [Gammaproteobacteria bacterium]